ncbi:MAG: sulfotransferase [Myxococcota bacterium]
MGDPRAASPSEQARLFLTNWLFSPLDGVRLQDWLRLLARHGGSIPPRYWAKVAFTSGMGALNSFMEPIERLRFEGRLARQRVVAPVFVLGHHRSGTTHLWNLLTQDPRFAYPSILQAVFPHTFLSMERLVRVLARPFTIRKRPQDNVEINPDSPVEEERALCAATFCSIQMARHFPARRARFEKYLTMREAQEEERVAWKDAFSHFARKLVLRHGADRRLIFKSPDHTGKMRLLLELFPDARFVHIHRHPFRVFNSTLKMERTTQPIYAYQTARKEELEDFVLWRYRTMYDAYFEDAPKVPEGQLAEVSFEDLDERPVETIEQVYQALGLPDFSVARSSLEAYVASLAGYRKNSFPDLPLDTKDRIRRAWEPSFERWGYAA